MRPAVVKVEPFELQLSSPRENEKLCSVRRGFMCLRECRPLFVTLNSQLTRAGAGTVAEPHTTDGKLVVEVDITGNLYE